MIINNVLFTYLIPNNKNENGYNDGKVTYHINRVNFNLNDKYNHVIT